MSYLRLYGWLHEVFGSKRFTIDDFRAAFPSPDPAKVLSDLVGLGWAERPERGVYRLRPPMRWSGRRSRPSRRTSL